MTIKLGMSFIGRALLIGNFLADISPNKYWRKDNSKIVSEILRDWTYLSSSFGGQNHASSPPTSINESTSLVAFYWVPQITLVPSIEWIIKLRLCSNVNWNATCWGSELCAFSNSITAASCLIQVSTSQAIAHWDLTITYSRGSAWLEFSMLFCWWNKRTNNAESQLVRVFLVNCKEMSVKQTIIPH